MYVNATSDGYVLATSKHKPSNMYGWTEIQGSLPPRPIAEDGTEPRLILKDGALVWQACPTAEELSEERKRAYETECDQYLIAYQGYLLEGNTAAAENCKQAYLAKKREIRARISGSTVEPVQNVTETPASEPEFVQIPIAGDDDLL